MTAKMRTMKKTFSQAPHDGGCQSRRILFGVAAVPLLMAGLMQLTSSAAHATLAATPSTTVSAAPKLRSVEGRVLDKKDDGPITGAVVYLKDTRTLSVKSYLTDDDGRFHFGQLADGADYEVWAEQSGQRSSSKSISQFNSKLDIQFTLKIDRTK